ARRMAMKAKERALLERSPIPRRHARNAGRHGRAHTNSRALRGSRGGAVSRWDLPRVDLAHIPPGNGRTTKGCSIALQMRSRTFTRVLGAALPEFTRRRDWFVGSWSGMPIGKGYERNRNPTFRGGARALA